jgi:hypothetical protein
MNDNSSVPSTDLYERDGLAWSERQTALLRRMVAGERLNEAPDWPNIIEEIEAMGRSELRQCESLLMRALVHLLKLRAWPGSRSAGHWRAEVFAFLTDAADAFTPSMRGRIDLPARYDRALRRARHETDDSGDPRPLPEICPFALEELLVENPDVAALVGILDRAVPASSAG